MSQKKKTTCSKSKKEQDDSPKQKTLQSNLNVSSYGQHSHDEAALKGDFWEAVRNSILSGRKDAKYKDVELSRLGELRLEMIQLRRSIRRAYEELGKTVVEIIESGQSIEPDDKIITDLLSRINIFCEKQKALTSRLRRFDSRSSARIRVNNNAKEEAINKGSIAKKHAVKRKIASKWAPKEKSSKTFENKDKEKNLKK